MTAELVVMNGRAVAMAADSAVTVSRGDEQLQTYFSANKLFSLSYKQPIGIMLYQGASLHSVPWETIIKMYRENLQDTRFNQLNDYAENFIKFLKNEHASLFPEELQKNDLKMACHNSLLNLQEHIAQEWRKKDKNRDPIKKFVNEKLVEIHKTIDKNAVPAWTKKKHKNKLLKFVKTEIENSKFAITKGTYIKNQDALCDIILDTVLTSPCFGYTGLVFAGFGEKDIFPSAYSFKICGFYLGELRIEHVDNDSKIEHGNQAMVIPYAQTDMVETFMSGISPLHNTTIKNTFLDRIIKGPIETIDEISDLSEEQKITWKSHFIEKSEKAAIEMMQNLDAHFYEKHTKSIIDGLRYLSKDELAYVAEAMLSLSTLHKKVSPGDDTVGGPVDLAVISKGDGLIWINRKHYFKPELNPHFFTRFSTFSERIEDDKD